MIRRIDDLPPAIVGLYVSGRVTRRDYDSVVTRLLDGAEREGEQLRLLIRFAPDFRRFTIGATIRDIGALLRSFDTVERMAVVTDSRWIERAVRLARQFLPYPMECYTQTRIEDAVAWLVAERDDERLAQRTELTGSVLVVEPRKPLCVEDIESLESRADDLIEEDSLRGVVVRAPKLPGWTTVGSLLRHMRFVRTRSPDIGRVAIAADGLLASVATRLAPVIARDLEVSRFAFDDLATAIAWAGDDGDGGWTRRYAS